MRLIFIIPEKALRMIRNSASSVIIVSLLAILALAFIEEKGSVRRAITAVAEKYRQDGNRGLWKLLWLLWTVVLLHVTIIGRSIDYNPLNELLSGWVIVKSYGVWNFDPLYNILMFIPYTFFLFLGFPGLTESIGDREVIKKAVKISFLFSLYIETTQLIFSCGTFQISDLVYNTISGMVGAAAYLVIRKWYLR